MSYPDLPRNRLIVGGVDITDKFKLVLEDGYTLGPPTPKVYTVDIPGGNGELDLTDTLLGEAAYEPREQEFSFRVINPSSFEQAKTDIMHFLHGRAFDYQMTMDPGYTYHGRFTIKSFTHQMYDVGKVGKIVVKVRADPFKYKTRQEFTVDAMGGAIINLPAGRMKVQPTITTSTYTRVVVDRKEYYLTAGTWIMNDVRLSGPTNQMFLNTYELRTLIHKELKEMESLIHPGQNGITWADLRMKPIYQWYRTRGSGEYVAHTWADFNQTWADFQPSSSGDYTWEQFTDKSWADLRYLSDIDMKIDPVKITYEWGDL